MVFIEVAIGAQLQLGCRLPVQFLSQLMGGGALHGAAVGPPIVEVVALGVEMAQGGATTHAALLKGKGGFGLRSAKIAVARVGFEKGGLPKGATKRVYQAGHGV